MQLEDYIEEGVKQKQHNKSQYDLEKGLCIDVKTLQKHFQFNKTQSQIIPVMVTVRTLEQTSGAQAKSNILEGRPNIDLICVIDNSGSMEGSKIQNVKNSILQLVDMLNEKDRLSIVLFNSEAEQLCGLKKLNKQNKYNLEKIINTISANGGTNIKSGVEKAFQILQTRRQKNPVSSIFLLSDGQDEESDIEIKNLLIHEYSKLQEECFTMHSFGFGNDHDGPLMQRISQIKDGNIYYVEKIDQVDEFFIDALGGLFSVVAQDINIRVQVNRQNNIFQKLFKNSYISKTYGPMWSVVTKNQELRIKINQIFQGVSKDFIFEITVPKFDIKELQDFERNLQLINVQLTACPVDSEYVTRVIKENKLVLTMFTEKEKIAEDTEINGDVEFNYFRVKAAEAIEIAIEYADKNLYQSGKMILNGVLNSINSSRNSNSVKLKVIKEDLMQCLKNVQPEQYQENGKFQLITQSNNNYRQASYAIKKNDIYQSSIQRSLVQSSQQQKMTYSQI